MSDTIVKLTRFSNEITCLILDFSTTSYSSVHSSFLFLALGCLYVGTLSILNCYDFLSFQEIWKFPLPLLFVGTHLNLLPAPLRQCGLHGNSDLPSWLFSFTISPSVDFLASQMPSSLIIFNLQFYFYFLNIYTYYYFFNSVSSQLDVNRLWESIEIIRKILDNKNCI